MGCFVKIKYFALFLRTGYLGHYCTIPIYKYKQRWSIVIRYHFVENLLAILFSYHWAAQQMTRQIYLDKANQLLEPFSPYAHNSRNLEWHRKFYCQDDRKLQRCWQNSCPCKVPIDHRHCQWRRLEWSVQTWDILYSKDPWWTHSERPSSCLHNHTKIPQQQV